METIRAAACVCLRVAGEHYRPQAPSERGVKVSLHPAQAVLRLLAEPAEDCHPHLHDTALGLTRLVAGDRTSRTSGKLLPADICLVP